MTQANPIQLKCPICQAMLSVSPDRAGQRIACDQCGSKIKVPGQAAAASDDDDWLSLESDLKPAPAPVRHAAPAELGDLDEFYVAGSEQHPDVTAGCPASRRSAAAKRVGP